MTSTIISVITMFNDRVFLLEENGKPQSSKRQQNDPKQYDPKGENAPKRFRTMGSIANQTSTEETATSIPPQSQLESSLKPIEELQNSEWAKQNLGIDLGVCQDKGKSVVVEEEVKTEKQTVEKPG